MFPSLRQTYNAAFSEEKYNEFIASIHSDWPNQLEFRVAETPVFVPQSLKNKLIEACESFVDIILGSEFKNQTQHAIPVNQNVPNENSHTSFLAIDFAICKDSTGELTPQLIELQGFPSVFGFQSYITEKFRDYFPIPDDFSNYFTGVTTQAEYISKLKKVILSFTEELHL